MDRRARRQYGFQHIEQSKVIDHAVVLCRDDADSGGVQLTRVGFTLVVQHVLFGCLHEGWREASQRLSVLEERRCVDL
jgi:hypothetical protein